VPSTSSFGGGNGVVMQDIGEDLQPVARPDVACLDLSGCQLEARLRTQTQAGDAKWSQVAPGPEHLAVLVQRDDVDGKQHAEGMDSARGLNEDAASTVQPFLAQEADEPCQEGIGQIDLGADELGLGRVSDGYLVHEFQPGFGVQATCFLR
jgi:hypothetical protein